MQNKMETSVLKYDEIEPEADTFLRIELGIIDDDIKLLQLRLSATHSYIEMLQRQLNEAIELEQELSRQLTRQRDHEASVKEKISHVAVKCEPISLLQDDLQAVDDDEIDNNMRAALEPLTGQLSKTMTMLPVSFEPADNSANTTEPANVGVNTVKPTSVSAITGRCGKRVLCYVENTETTGGDVVDECVSHAILDTSNSSQRRYTCQWCGVSCSSFKALRNHRTVSCKLRPELPQDLRLRFLAYQHQCPKCRKKFSTKGSLHRHLEICKGKQPVGSAASAPAVVGRVSSKEITIDSVSSKKVSDDDNFDSLSCEWRSLFYQCPYCKLCYTIRRDLEIHLQKKRDCHAKYACQQEVGEKVSLRMKYVAKRNAHLIVDDLSNPTVRSTKSKFTNTSCYACGKTDVVEWSEYCTTSDRICVNCEKLFHDRGAVVDASELSTSPERIRPSDGGNRFTCLVCKKKFLKIMNVFLHLRTHTGYRPHICYKCGCGYHISNSLKMHLSQHDVDKTCTGETQCDICSKNFLTGNLLKGHKMRVHSSERPYVCAVCGKAYAVGYELQIHMRNHTGVRPYACRMCPKTFIMANHLQKHVRTNHADRKPDRCPLCFKEVFNLSRHHKEIHLGRKRIQFKRK